jgi:hypothetical protein
MTGQNFRLVERGAFMRTDRVGLWAAIWWGRRCGGLIAENREIGVGAQSDGLRATG